MFETGSLRLRRIEKADLWHLWEWHERDELYLFNAIKSHISWDEVHDNFNTHFSWKGDFIVENKDLNIIGICSYQYINWKNRSCEISFKMKEAGNNFLFSVDAIRVLVSFIFNELNLITIVSYIPEWLIFDIKIIEKIGFTQEGILREHIFRDNKYFNKHIFSLLKEGLNNNA